jgi:hypothetical protein
LCQGRRLRILDPISGMSVSDTRSEQKIVRVIAMPTSPSQICSSVFSPTMSGRKTMAVVVVAAMTAIATAEVPRIEACRASPIFS